MYARAGMGKEGRNEQLAPENRKSNTTYTNPHLSVPRKILAGFLYFTSGTMTLAHKTQSTALGSG